jgi:N-acetylglucosamine malate deacetylase 2
VRRELAAYPMGYKVAGVRGTRVPAAADTQEHASDLDRTQMSRAALPPWTSVLAVVAHPDDESFALGAVLDAFVQAGAEVTVLCFTRGEASTLHGVEGDLATVREAELSGAARELGVQRVVLRDYPDGGLSQVPIGELVDIALEVADDGSCDGLVTFDPDGVTGHPDHQQATGVAMLAGQARGLRTLGWTIPEAVARALRDEFGAAFSGHPIETMDLVLPVDRATQRRAVDCHPSQAVPGSALWRRLELLGDHEYLRWLD